MESISSAVYLLAVVSDSESETAEELLETLAVNRVSSRFVVDPDNVTKRMDCSSWTRSLTERSSEFKRGKTIDGGTKSRKEAVRELRT